MTLCYHIWIPMSPALDGCSRCGAQRTPPTPHVHLQSGAIVRPTIPTTTIHGEPVEWPPITEKESHE